MREAGTPLRVLLVEDSENDALLLLRELRRGGYEPICEQVSTAEEMEKVLGEATRGLSEAVRSGHSESYPEISDRMLVSVARDSEHLRIMRQIGFASAMIMPLVARGLTLGAITRVSAESGRRYEKATEPKRVLVRLELVGDIARVEVADDGRGFEVASTRSGMVQHSTRHRARELGGELVVESTPGSGTRVRLEIPTARLIGEDRPEGDGPPGSGDEDVPTA